ncbi:MAG TPA: hypothetical protein VGL94_10350 [Ktedonobacteraceae bacterium]|jgi:hypothetical protein
MAKMYHLTSKGFIGIALILSFMFITSFFSIVPSADAILHGHGKKKGPSVQGSVDLTVLQPQSPQSPPPTQKNNSVQANPSSPGPTKPLGPPNPGNQLSVLAITLNLKNIPKGQHRADIHQGSCPLTFNLNGAPPADGPFTPGVTLPLGNVEAKADGTLQKTLAFAVGGTTGIPTDLLSSGKWFFCIHTGTLEELQGKTPDELFASLQTFLKTNEGPGQVKQLACQALNGSADQKNLTIKINGVQKQANPPASAPPTPKPN